MPVRDPPANSLVSTTKRAASIGQLSQASSYEEVRLEDLDRSSDSEEDRSLKAEATASLSAPQKAETPSKTKVTARPPVPTAKPEDMHMIDDDNDMVQPNDKKDVSLRELHDPIEGDSANISWRGNHDVKAQAGGHEAQTLSMLAATCCPHQKILTVILPMQPKKPKHTTLLVTTPRTLTPSRMLSALLTKPQLLLLQLLTT